MAQQTFNFQIFSLDIEINLHTMRFVTKN